jgi:hypothetical protein
MDDADQDRERRLRVADRPDPDGRRWEAAEWMVTQLRRCGVLDQQHAAGEIARLFGEHLVYRKPSGAYAIDRRLLHRFAVLAGDEALWSRSQRRWRRRRPEDPRGRVTP